ncbi:MAG: GDP-mannose 4,6-dehydratase [Cyclobacteriaceae bacterium]
MMKAFITGINGQDGSYLSELLIEKGYEVNGLIRRTSEPLNAKIKHLEGIINLHQGDMTDSSSLHRIIEEVRPDEIYNLAAMSHVGWSYKNPTQTFEVNTLGYTSILEACRTIGIEPKIYQACSSEMFGKVQEIPQKEKTPFYPRSPYGASKVASYYVGKLYRESYSMKIYNGILFNHESERRGTEFLSRKVCKSVGEISRGEREFMTIGNMEAKRDFGYAKEYVEWIWNIMQYDTPDDFVISTGETHSVREWVEESFKVAGYTIRWEGEGLEEVGYDLDDNVRVKIDPKFFRPSEVDLLIGDSSKSKEILGFEPKIKFKQLVEIMTKSEL